MRVGVSALLLGVVLAAVGAGAVVLARSPFAPDPVQCLAGDDSERARWLSAAMAGAVAAMLTALLAAGTARGTRAGGFGAVAGVVLAGGVPLALTVPAPPPALLWWSPAPAVALAFALLPVLRDRGLWSLLLATLLAAPGYVAAWRAARLRAHAAAPFEAAAAALSAVPAAALELSPAGAATAMVLAARLRPPFAPTGTALFAASADSLAAGWLRRMDLPRFGWDGAECRVLAPAPDAVLPRGERPIAVAFARDAAGRARSLSIGCDGARIGWIAAVYTPAGAAVLPFDDDGHADSGRVDPGDDAAELSEWLLALPSAAPIRVLVVAPGSADVQGWTELRP